MPPAMCRPRPGSARNSGRPSRQRLTLPEQPRSRQRETSSTSCTGMEPSGGRATRLGRGARLDSTTDASISAPSSRATPVTWPSRVVSAATVASVRIVAPRARAADAIASATAPVPPLGNAQARKTPSISPM